MFLLDTNVVSELRKAHNADQKVRRWAEEQSPERQFVTAITIRELQYGILLKRRHAEAEAAKLADWLHQRIFPQFAGRIIAMDAEIAVACAALHVPRRRPERDAWIAATAIVHRMTVVTRNVRDFAETGANLVNPWE